MFEKSSKESQYSFAPPSSAQAGVGGVIRGYTDVVILEIMGGDIPNQRQSQCSLSSFNGEYDFTHCTQDEDHGSRRAGLDI